MKRFPSCHHEHGEQPIRAEYCEVDGSSIDGVLEANVMMIDELLHERGDLERGASYSSDGNIKYIERSFNYLQGIDNQKSLPPIEMEVAIVHERNTKLESDCYGVKIGWRSLQAGAPKEFYQTFYTIEQWPKVAFATIDENHIATERLKTQERRLRAVRPMTEYDHDVLFRTFYDLEQMCRADEREREVLAGA